jgi:hypothetical protein
MPVVHVIGVVAVAHGLVAARRRVLVAVAAVLGVTAGRGIPALVPVRLVLAMGVSIVQVIGVVTVGNGRVLAAAGVGVRMTLMGRMG